MSYIKLKVRSGGIYLGQEKERGIIGQKEGQRMDRDLSPHPEDNSQKVLPLVRDSSIKGLFSYLMGETKKINAIKKSQKSLIKKLNATLDLMVQASALQKITEPYITTFFERRDAHTRNFISPSSVSLYKYSILEAEETIRNLRKPLKDIMMSSLSSLADIHSFFKKHEIKSTEPGYEKLREYILKYLQQYSGDSKCEESKKIIKEWSKILRERSVNKKDYNDLQSNIQVLFKKKNTASSRKVPEYNKLTEKLISEESLQESGEEKHIINELKKIIDKKTENEKQYNDLKPSIETILKKHFRKIIPINQKITDGFFTALKKIIDEKPISSKVPILIEKICILYNKDPDFANQIKELEKFQFSSFTNLGQTKAWIDKKYYPIVRGTPAYIACVDFDIYLSEEAFTENQSSDHFNWEEVIQKLRNGPNIARWGEGGIVLIDYNGLDEMGCPYSEKEQMFVEIKALRSAGLKIKKYDWEIEKEDKTQKRKGKKH